MGGWGEYYRASGSIVKLGGYGGWGERQGSVDGGGSGQGRAEQGWGVKWKRYGRQTPGCQGADTDKSTQGRSGKESSRTVGWGAITQFTHERHTDVMTTESSRRTVHGGEQRVFYSNCVTQY